MSRPIASNKALSTYIFYTVIQLTGSETTLLLCDNMQQNTWYSSSSRKTLDGYAEFPPRETPCTHVSLYKRVD